MWNDSKVQHELQHASNKVIDFSRTACCPAQVLAAEKSLASYGIADSAVLELVPLTAHATAAGSPPLSSPQHGLFADWQAAQAGLASGMRPQLAASGSGGSYFIPNAHGDKVAVLKPADEEPFSVNNPRHMGCSPDGHGLRKVRIQFICCTCSSYSPGTPLARQNGVCTPWCVEGLKQGTASIVDACARRLVPDSICMLGAVNARSCCSAGHPARRGGNPGGGGLCAGPQTLCGCAADRHGHLPAAHAAGRRRQRRGGRQGRQPAAVCARGHRLRGAGRLSVPRPRGPQDRAGYFLIRFLVVLIVLL